MSTFVLVHGAWHGSWCWKRVRHRLQLAGHDVFTPTLTGLGERSHLLARGVNLSTHIEDVVNLIRWEELHNLTLCGHSYGGAVVSGVAERIPERIRALVYLDAFVLESGENVLENVHESQRHLLIEATRKLGDGWKTPPIPATVFNVNAADRDWVDRQCTAHPYACFEEPLLQSDGIRRIASITYIVATDWEDTPFGRALERARGKGWRILSMACGHDAMLDAPEELARELVGTASR